MKAKDEPSSPKVLSNEVWVDICALEDVIPATGVAAMLNGEQIAVVRSPDGSSVFALSNFDPFSKAFVIARGIVGDRGGVLKIASPIFKQNFDLRTGVCLDDPSVTLPVYPVRLEAGRILIAARKSDPQ
ncbi:MAG: nitrite reductase small subunit NirD [Polyangiaceae bacterium]